MTTSALKVLTFNIRNNWAVQDGRNWWGFRRKAVIRTIEAADADLVALQEVRLTQLRYLRRELREYRFVTGGRRDGHWRGEHCTVLIKPKRFELLDWHVRWFSPTPEVAGSRDPDAPHPRIATHVQLQDRNGDRLGFVNLHLDHHSTAARSRAVQMLIDMLPKNPTIITGDFNCAIDDPVLAPLWASGFEDALSALPARGASVATAHAFRGITDGSRIDHILVPAGSRIDEARVESGLIEGRLASDHWPVTATVTLPPER